MLDNQIYLHYIGCSEQYTEHLEGGEKMAKLKVHRAFDEFLLDPNLSLIDKGFPVKSLSRQGDLILTH